MLLFEKMDKVIAFEKKINSLKSLDLMNIDENEIIQELRTIKDQIALTLKLKKGTEICRTRIVENVEKDIPKYVGEISYNPKPSPNYGRAHLKGESVFYGSLSTEKMKHYFNTSFEVFKLNDKMLERQFFVTSKWILQEDITVIDVGNSLMQDKVRMNQRRKFFDNVEVPSTVSLESAKLFDNYICEEFSKIVTEGEEALYKSSGAYASLMFGLGVKGILYASVGSNGAGLNIVLPSYLIDEGVLLPHSALFGTMYNRYGEYINDYSMKAKVEGSVLRWQDTYELLPPEVKNYYTGKSDDKSFQEKILFMDLGIEE